MTIPQRATPVARKHAGLSHLADAARRDGEQILHSYPIKKKGEPRRLLPNQAGIEWLESDANGFDDTDIEYQESMGSGELTELIVDYSYGRGAHRYARPMFQIIPRDAFSGMGPSVTPCSCDRFDLSWDATRCETHAEVEWDTERKVWKRPGATAPRAYAPPTVPEALVAMYEQLRAQGLPTGRCNCGECQRLRERGFDGRDGFSPEVQNAERRRQRQAQIYAAIGEPPADPGILGGQWLAEDSDVWRFTREADPGINPWTGERSTPAVDVLARIRAESVPTFGGITGSFELEVNGETLQGIQSFSIEVEPNNDRT